MIKITYKIWRFRGQNSWYISAWYKLLGIPFYVDQSPGRWESYSHEQAAEDEVDRIISLKKSEPMIVRGRSIEA